MGAYGLGTHKVSRKRRTIRPTNSMQAYSYCPYSKEMRLGENNAENTTTNKKLGSCKKIPDAPFKIPPVNSVNRDVYSVKGNMTCSELWWSSVFDLLVSSV